MRQAKKSKAKVVKETKKKTIKAQTWSIDMSIGVVIFLLVMILVYVLINPPQGSDEQLRIEADRVYSRIDQTVSGSEDELFKIIEGTTLDEEKLKELAEKYDYDTLKSMLGIEGDFCIVLVDQYGGLKNISESKITIGETNTDLIVGYDEDSNPIYCGE